ncbi:putative papain-like cysteine peptidase superfamily [Helianthus debilis subsp. tardiflorus]
MQKVDLDGTKDKSKSNQIVSSQPSFSLGISPIQAQTPMQKVDLDGTEDKSKQIVSSQPSFSLGISPIQIPYEEMDAEKQNAEDVTERPHRIKHPTYASKSPYLVRVVDICKPLTKDELKIWDYLMEGLEKKQLDDVFESASGIATKKFLLRSLEPGQTLLSNVIDCWAAVLNHDEELRSPGSDKRLFCDTNVMTIGILEHKKMDEAERLDVIASSIKELLKGSEDKPNLKAFRVVLIPIAENGHYYLICFNLKNPAIEVIDNIHETKSFVGLQDNDDYNKKDTVLKVMRF